MSATTQFRVIGVLSGMPYGSFVKDSENTPDWLRGTVNASPTICGNVNTRESISGECHATDSLIGKLRVN